MRTIVISRYSMGFVGGTIFALLNILTQLGFSCTAVILGGQTLTNVSNGKLPVEASIVIVGILALILCFVGYNGASGHPASNAAMLKADQQPCTTGSGTRGWCSSSSSAASSAWPRTAAST